MPRITEQLVRKRAEHNEGDIASLEELSLHQQELEKIEHLDRWCKHLKILYLQNNLIPRVENVARLKELQYLNLALNNVEKIENLEGCEFLEKLDFTVNFIGDLLSVESLRSNLHLRELYLTGNPCTEYEGYREFVVATLPQLAMLDGKEVTRSERIAATQQLEDARNRITAQQQQHALRREKEKEEFREKESKTTKQKSPGFDGRWYTDPNAHVSTEKDEVDIEEDEEEAYTPEYRVKSYKDMARKKMEQAKEPENKLEMPKRVRTLEREGKMLNVNEGKHNFHLRDEETKYILEVECPRYMETSLIDCDVQPTYVRLNIKSKILQLVLEDEVSPDSCSVKRSQTTGHLLLDLPKAKPVLRAQTAALPKPQIQKVNVAKNTARELEVYDRGQGAAVDASSITAMDGMTTHTKFQNTDKKQSGATKHDFEDDPDVPPLI